ncbi:MAG: VTT domain-containing protein [Desulfomonilaceae bacterium]|nr:VTT domain-containing protein [Desulfomonilaceae bacterium]
MIQKTCTSLRGLAKVTDTARRDSKCVHGILQEGRNCRRKRRSGKVAFLIDGDAYFRALHAAIGNARKRVYIAGWDIDSRISLLRDNAASMKSSRLSSFLEAVVARNHDLHVYLLAWDFAAIFALERELLPVFKFGPGSSDRIHFHMDDQHPLGASHHQKIVVVDDAVGFVGGLDLTRDRWDTPEHRAQDPRRVNPDGRPYTPFHDVQMMVDGDAASSLGDLFRRRWKQASGEVLQPPGPADTDPWPSGLAPDVTDVDIAISRTEPAFNGRGGVREIEALYRDAIAAARDSIYIESQYFTSREVAVAVSESLKQEAGPEIVIVLPYESSGWLEHGTMDTGRAFILKRLHDWDATGRLRVYYPRVPGVRGIDMTLHSKVLIVDDELVRIGSSNVSNRSMGLDTECDLAMEALGDDRIRKAIRGLRNRLLAEHLGTTPEAVQRRHEQHKSLIRAIEHLRGDDRTLETLKVEMPQWLEAVSLDTNPADPERTVDPTELINQFVPDELKKWGVIDYLKPVVVLGLVAALAVAWRWSPLGSRLDESAVIAVVNAVSASPVAIVPVVLLYVIGGLVMVPVTLLITAVAIVFDPLLSIVYATSGCLAAATVNYALGWKLGREMVRRLARGRLNRISKRLARRGLTTVLVLRVVPVAPYSIVNLALGASHVSFRDYFLGTLLGMFPGIVIISVFGESVRQVLRHPDLKSIAFLVGVLVATVVLGVLIKRYLVGDREDV